MTAKGENGESGTGERGVPVAPLVAVCLAAAVLRAGAFDVFSVVHVDELFQYLERANRLVNHYGVVSWETRYGMRNWLIPQILAVPVWIGTKLAPGSLLAPTLAKLTACLISFAQIFAAYAIGWTVSRRHAFVAAFAVAIWFPCVYFASSVLSENFGASAILAGTAFALNAGERRGRWIVAGFLLALGCLFRFPYAVFCAIFALACCRTAWRQWAWLAAGAAGALVLGALSDLGAGQVPYAWLLKNYGQNIAAGRSQGFGVEGPLFYLVQSVKSFGIAMPLLAALAFLAPPRLRPLLLAAIADVVAHSLLAHKELRFVYLSSCVLVILAAIVSTDLLERFLPARRRRTGPLFAWILIAALSRLTITEMGPLQNLDFSGRLAARAVRAAPVCGLGVSFDYRYAVPASYLGRDVPLFVFSRSVLTVDPDRVPAPVTRAANALVMKDTQAIPAGYVAKDCEGDPGAATCTYVRPGTCDASAAGPYRLDNAMRADDL